VVVVIKVIKTIFKVEISEVISDTLILSYAMSGNQDIVIFFKHLCLDLNQTVSNNPAHRADLEGERNNQKQVEEHQNTPLL
jgi:hypothetical protein